MIVRRFFFLVVLCGSVERIVAAHPDLPEYASRESTRVLDPSSTEFDGSRSESHLKPPRFPLNFDPTEKHGITDERYWKGSDDMFPRTMDPVSVDTSLNDTSFDDLDSKDRQNLSLILKKRFDTSPESHFPEHDALSFDTVKKRVISLLDSQENYEKQNLPELMKELNVLLNILEKKKDLRATVAFFDVDGLRNDLNRMKQLQEIDEKYENFTKTEGDIPSNDIKTLLTSIGQGLFFYFPELPEFQKAMNTMAYKLYKKVSIFTKGFKPKATDHFEKLYEDYLHIPTLLKLRQARSFCKETGLLFPLYGAYDGLSYTKVHNQAAGSVELLPEYSHLSDKQLISQLRRLSRIINDKTPFTEQLLKMTEMEVERFSQNSQVYKKLVDAIKPLSLDSLDSLPFFAEGEENSFDTIVNDFEGALEQFKQPGDEAFKDATALVAMTKMNILIRSVQDGIQELELFLQKTGCTSLLKIPFLGLKGEAENAILTAQRLVLKEGVKKEIVETQDINQEKLLEAGRSCKEILHWREYFRSRYRVIMKKPENVLALQKYRIQVAINDELAALQAKEAVVQDVLPVNEDLDKGSRPIVDAPVVHSDDKLEVTLDHVVVVQPDRDLLSGADFKEALPEEMRASIDKAYASFGVMKTVAGKLVDNPNMIDSIGLAQRLLNAVLTYEQALPLIVKDKGTLAREINDLKILIKYVINRQKMAVVASLQDAYKSFRSSWGTKVYPKLTSAFVARAQGMLSVHSQDNIQELPFNEFLQEAQTALNESLRDSKGFFDLLQKEQRKLQTEFDQGRYKTEFDRMKDDSQSGIGQAFADHKSDAVRGAIAGVNDELGLLEKSYMVAVFDTLDEDQKEEFKMHNESLYFALRAQDLKDRVTAYLLKIYENFSFDSSTVTQGELDLYFDSVEQYLGEYEVFYRELRGAKNVNDAFRAYNILAPLYARLSDIKQAFTLVRSSKVRDTLSLWKRLSFYFSPRYHPFDRNYDNLSSSRFFNTNDQFLKNPVAYLHSETLFVQERLDSVDIERLKKKAKKLLDEAEKGQTEKRFIYVDLLQLEAQLERYKKISDQYEAIKDTYAALFAADPGQEGGGLLAFEKDENGRPLSNEQVLTFMVEALSQPGNLLIPPQRLLDASRETLLERLTATGKATGEKMDRRYRDLVHVLNNDFVWDLERMKLEGRPVKIDYEQVRKNFHQFIQDYPHYSMEAQIRDIGQLFTQIREVAANK